MNKSDTVSYHPFLIKNPCKTALLICIIIITRRVGKMPSATFVSAQNFVGILPTLQLTAMILFFSLYMIELQ